MIKLIRESIFSKYIACFIAVTVLFQIVFPLSAYALTGGPSQPEVQSFEPVGTSEMVDLFSGDFNYNIPLLDVEGYPINISYHAGITADQEASWVGLGWNINPGVINRNMRGVPDDFNGEQIHKTFSMKGNKTYGLSGNFSTELIGMDKVKPAAELAALKESRLGKLSFGLGLSYNNYTGVGFEIQVSPSFGAGDKNKSGLTGGLGLSASSEGGVGISPSMSYSRKQDNEINKESHPTHSSLSVGASFNSRSGMSNLTLGGSQTFNKTQTKTDKATGKENTTYLYSRGMNGGSSISFASPSYTPQIKMPLYNVNVSVAATIGLAAYGVHGSVLTKGYFSGQYLYKNDDNPQAYGYLYAHNSSSTFDVHDFNREKDGAYSEHTPNLPLTNQTYDIYAVSGQGIGGTYRPYRSDIGMVYDPEVRNFTGGLDIGGIEIGGGALVHGGMNFNVNESDAYSGKWLDDNDAHDIFNFSGANPSDPYYEPVYFKQAGEKTTENIYDVERFERLGGFDPVRINLRDDPNSNRALKELTTINEVSKKFDDGYSPTRKQRARRNEVVTTLTVAEAVNFAVDKTNKSYPFNYNQSAGSAGLYNNPNNSASVVKTVLRGDRPAAHISEISAYRADGSRYVYGIPAYNTTQAEVSFAVSDQGESDGLVSYAANSDNSVNNNKALDNFFDKTELPAYAHSYLLTSILSPDYIDQLNDGPTEDDLGTYTKINYSRIENYKWRTPYDANKANFNEGLRTKCGASGDNKANYVYGEKELWYIHSIESKNYVAYFYTSDRLDGYDVAGENGGQGTGRSKRLDRIELYAKSDLQKPIKTVHFKYDYLLCKNAKNTAGGTGAKLTLTEIYFTYGKSNKARQRGYKFYYGANLSAASLATAATGTGTNYDYNMKSYDRWGNYKAGSDNAEYPYSEQNKVDADKYAAAWCMNAIELPSGGIIKVKYEADDYAYVQDKKAMQMFKVIGSSITQEGPNDVAGVKAINSLYENSGLQGITGLGKVPYEYIYIELQEPVKNNAELRAKYFCEPDGTLMSALYYKFLVKIESGSGGCNSNNSEYVPGYIDASEIQFGLCTKSAFLVEGKSKYAWIRLNPVTLGDYVPVGKANPIAHTAWNFVKMNLPRVAYAKDDPGGGAAGVLEIFTAMFSTLKQIQQLFTGFYFDLRQRNIAQSFDNTGKSFVRLYNPNGKKIGGGHRVVKIEVDDQFKTMLSNNPTYENTSYGQVYDYTTKNEYGEVISSGVAAYEPTLGGEENPFRQAIKTTQTNFMAPSDEFIQETPFGETFFPSPSVGYSKITVRNIRSDSPSDNEPKNTTGAVVHEFYTAKDFPTIVHQTGTEAHRYKPYPMLSFLKMYSEDNMSVSQGYSVELNDMHGKPKGQKVYASGNDETPISKVEYVYKKDPNNGKHLSNSVSTINKKGEITTSAMVGVEFDMVADMREQKTVTRTPGLGGNLDGFLVFLPIVIPMILPSYQQEEVRFRSMVVTKVINRYGILESTINEDMSSSVTIQNMVYDEETGEVLLTKTSNQYDDPVYNMNFPAHWAYESMGQSYRNIGLTVSVNEAFANPANYFVPGDELMIGNIRGWVHYTSPKLVIMDEQGYSILKDDIAVHSLKVIRSGRRNQQNLTMATISTLSNPIVNNDSDPAFELGYNNIIAAGATLFTQESGIFCECGLDKDPTTGVYPAYNPYIKGKYGIWKVKRSYVKLTDRTQTRYYNNLNVRKDGVFAQFSPFYIPNNGNSWKIDATGWTSPSEVTIFGPDGVELENKDALNRFSSSVYGYNNKLPIAVAANAQRREIAFDNFEDYDYATDCANHEQHFGFKRMLTPGGHISVSESVSHSGKRSLKLQYRCDKVSIKRVINPCKY